MRNLLEKMDVNLLPDDSFILDDIEDELRSDLNSSGLLKKGKFYMGTSNGLFDDSTWIIELELYQTYSYFKFDILKELKFRGLDDDNARAIKCWVAHELLDGITASRIQTKYKYLTDFIRLTNNFHGSYLKQEGDSSLITIFKEYEGDKASIAVAVIEYLYYIEQFNIRFSSKNLEQFITQLVSFTDGKVINKARVLPKSSDVLAFSYYLSKFFKENTLHDLKIYFMPILLWWKITSIIPMRPSEFCFKIKRGCIIKKNDKIYLKIGRIKERKSKRNYKTQGKLPLLDRVEISKEIYDLIDSYIKETDEYGASETLISYRAYVASRAAVDENSGGKYQCFKSSGWDKYNPNAFSYEILNTILNNFYNVIINDYYKETRISERVKLNDTRHFAFTSLMLQGVSPVEIAMLGGHTHLGSQNAYQSSVSYYVDCEMVNLVNLNQVNLSVSNKTIKNIVFQNSKNCPKKLENCFLTEDGVGYCTCDISQYERICEDEEYCFYCSKWWCEPTEDNYIKIKKKIKESLIPAREKKVREEEIFLRNILRTVGIESINGVLTIKKDSEETYNIARINLKRDVDRLVEMKASLNEFTNEVNRVAFIGDNYE